MKKIFFIIMAFALAVSSCQKDWDTPNTENAYGNPKLEITNLKTIAEVKDSFKNYVTTSYSYKQVTKPMQIVGVVTGNDIGGNMYSEIAIQDSTAAIIIAIQHGGLWGSLPIGAKILVELNGLYLGNYGLQPEIGTPYTNSSGNTYVSRMNPMLWQEHYKILSYGEAPEPEVFADGKEKTTWDLYKDAGKLGVLKNVTFKEGGRTTWATPNAGSGNKSLYFNEQTQTVMVYTSNYAQFCADTIPSGKVNITGIFKRYSTSSKDSWEILLRSIEDCEEVK
ncbi:MAG: hypothetical protein KBS94_08780 [Prevotella sp.]|nr:hypothetical protein [Candidatus Equicola faecalis]